MASIYLESDNTKNIKLFVELAKKLGVAVSKTSKSAVMPKKKGSDFYIALQDRIEKKMTREEINEHINTLRDELVRDI